MAPKEYIDILKKYLDSNISLEQLRDIVDNRLFALRMQSPELTEEGEFLSGIELIIEEVKDGFRTEADLAEYIKSLIKPGDLSKRIPYSSSQVPSEH